MPMKVKGSCKLCGGAFKFQRCDMKRIYVRCMNCGAKGGYTFKSEEEARLYAEEANREILGRLREHYEHWELAQWDQLHADIVTFINTHPYVETDIRFQMAKIACVTKGFHIMDDEIYQRCKDRFAVADEIYKGLLKIAKEKASDPIFSETMESYEQARADYVHLRNEYIALKTTEKVIKVVLKKATKPFLPF